MSICWTLESDHFWPAAFANLWTKVFQHFRPAPKTIITRLGRYEVEWMRVEGEDDIKPVAGKWLWVVIVAWVSHTFTWPASFTLWLNRDETGGLHNAGCIGLPKSCSPKSWEKNWRVNSKVPKCFYRAISKIKLVYGCQLNNSVQ